MAKRAWLVAAAVAVGCGPTLDGGDDVTQIDDASSGPAGTGGALPGNDSGLPPPTTTSDSSSATGDDDGSGSIDDGTVFLPDTDGCWVDHDSGYLAHCLPIDCSMWEQDCPRGEKCTPWANDGGSAFNAHRCVPVVDEPAADGEPCTVEGSPVSGLDNCELGSLCWDVDSDTLEGTCYAHCSGPAENPQCEGDSWCAQSGSSILALCIPRCSPLVPDDCDGLCVPAGSGEFSCVDPMTELQPYGGPCTFVNDCETGLFCANPEAIGCDQPDGCCGAFCDLALGDPNPGCPDAELGHVCLPFFEKGRAPEGQENVGYCAPGGAQ